MKQSWRGAEQQLRLSGDFKPYELYEFTVCHVLTFCIIDMGVAVWSRLWLFAAVSGTGNCG